MTKEEFKEKWEADERGSGITYDDIADRAKEWGLYEDPKCHRIEDVTYSVLKAANCCDAEEFNPNKLLETASIAETALGNGEYEKAYTITLKDRQEIYDREFN